MNRRKIGNLEVSAVGYGCMGLSQGFGPETEDGKAVRLLQKAYETGYTFFDTAEAYGNGKNEELVHKALHAVRNQIEIATKLVLPEIPISNLQKEIESHLDASLKRLDTDRIDLYYLHYIPAWLDVEETAGCMGRMLQKGKIRGWGLCQCSEQELRLSHAVTPLTAIQGEFSMMARMFEKDVLPACEELGIGFVAFSPLAKGFLSGETKADAEYTGFDFRRVLTRFSRENVLANQPLVDLLQHFAAQKEVSMAQLSLAWILHKSPSLVPIPGARSEKRIKENHAAAQVTFTEAEFNALEAELAKIEIHGDRSIADLAKIYEIDNK